MGVLGRLRNMQRARAQAAARKKLASRPRPPRAVPGLGDLASARILVVIAHPDDEVIAAGALMARAARVGVICVTNGAPYDGSAAQAAGFDSWISYAQARAAESAAALALLDRDIAPCENLAMADQAVYTNLVPLTRHLLNHIRDGFTHVITHAYEGGHPDHDSVAFAVHAACALMEAAGESAPTIVDAPFYSAPDGDLVYGRFVPHSDAGPEVVTPLAPKQQALKRRLFACHATQADVLALFSVEEERFRVAPRYHFAASPHPGEVGYAQWRWLVSGPTWRDHVWRAMERLGVTEALA